MQWSTTIICYK